MVKTRKHRGTRITRKRQRGSKPTVVVGLIHANWCGHCQHLMPEWNKMKQMSNDDGGDVNVVEFEESEENREQKMKDLHPELKAEGFPTVFKIVDGKLEYYNGGRTAEEIRSWALEREPMPEPPSSIQSDRTFLGRLFGGYVYKKTRLPKSFKSIRSQIRTHSRKRKIIKTRRIVSPVEKLN